MRAFILLPILLFLIFIGQNALAQESKPSPEDPSGRWIGEYTLGSDHVFLVVKIRKESRTWAGTYNRPLLDWENYLDLAALKTNGSEVSFDFGGSAAPLHAEMHWRQNSLEGTVTTRESRGKIILEAAATLPKEYMESLAGNYLSADGDYVIERENNYLCFLNRRTGRSGRLMPQSETEFWSGPTMDIWYPAQFHFSFVRGSGGNPEKLYVTEPGNQNITLDRKELYRREEITFENAGATLVGTLRRPPNIASYPAVVLLHGSNYQTRGGQYAALGFMADQFARNGFVALTYDKRGTGKSGGQLGDDAELLSGDGASAVRFLRSRPEVDAKKIGLWGISQGGIAEPLVSRKAGGIAFFVNVSGAVVNTNRQEIQRTELILRADGFPPGDIAAAVHFQEVKFHYACKRDNWEEYEKVLQAAQGRPWLPDPYIGPPDSKSDTAWDFWKCGIEPGDYWETVHAPVLYVQGEFEAYSKPAENLKRLEQAMRKAGNRHFEHTLMRGAEHSMFHAKTGGEKETPLLNTYVYGYFQMVTNWATHQVRSD
jgi:dienelactone hydrolase